MHSVPQILSGSPTAEPANDFSAARGQPPELQLIYDTAPIGLAFLSPDCRYLQINQRLTEICGISVADHIGRSVRETVPQVADQVEKIAELILSTGEPIIGVEASQVIASIRAMFGKDGGERTELDLNELVRQVVAIAHGELESHQASLQMNLSDRPLPVLADRVPLQQVFLNLLVNAIEAMAAVLDRPRVLSVSSELHGTDHVFVKMKDTGAGIDPDDMGRIFDAFFTTKPNGMGMGLAICRSIVEAHGGRLWASAGIPHGSIFHVALPRPAR
jgi:signal transduction histidine kinase